MQVLEEAVLSDLVYGVVNCPADQFGARCACLPPQFVELLDLLSGELNLRFLHQGDPSLRIQFPSVGSWTLSLVARWVQMPQIATRGFVD